MTSDLRTRVSGPWSMLLGLAVAETLSWGIVYYSFSVFIRPLEMEMGWSRTQVTGAFSVALLIAGLAAVPVGHWVDARGARGLMTTGSVLGALLLFLFATVSSLAAFYAVWACLGVVMAMVLYEPAFAVVATRFVRQRDRALTILTLFGGLASTLVVPLATWLLQKQGWRGAVATLGILLACTTTPLHGWVLRTDPASVGQHPGGDVAATEPTPVAPPSTSAGIGPVMAEPRFWGLTVAFALASLVTVATTVHVIPYLTAHGVSATNAGAVLGLIGLMQLPGRAVFSPIRRRLSWQWTATMVFMMQAVALVVLTRTRAPSGFMAFACLFGMGNGMSTLLRASTLADLYEQGIYGRVSGVVALFTTVGRAAGPVIASLALVAAGRYERVFVGLALILAVAAALVAIRGDSQRRVS